MTLRLPTCSVRGRAALPSARRSRAATSCDAQAKCRAAPGHHRRARAEGRNRRRSWRRSRRISRAPAVPASSEDPAPIAPPGTLAVKHTIAGSHGLSTPARRQRQIESGATNKMLPPLFPDGRAVILSISAYRPKRRSANAYFCATNPTSRRLIPNLWPGGRSISERRTNCWSATRPSTYSLVLNFREEEP